MSDSLKRFTASKRRKKTFYNWWLSFTTTIKERRDNQERKEERISTRTEEEDTSSIRVIYLSTATHNFPTNTHRHTKLLKETSNKRKETFKTILAHKHKEVDEMKSNKKE